MSGKSTYLKHNAIICLLSQIGAYIPADKANLTTLDKIFVRQGSVDDIINNNSSFMVEMDDFKYIIDNSTNNSLVILDEPAKSTNSIEGGAIARAFCEYLAKNNKPKMLVATHNMELTKSEATYPNNFINLMVGDNNNDKITKINRRIQKGIAKTSQAINTAMLANLPSEIIETAQEYIKN
jgi:DNA mismatch repair protein MutS